MYKIIYENKKEYGNAIIRYKTNHYHLFTNYLEVLRDNNFKVTGIAKS